MTRQLCAKHNAAKIIKTTTRTIRDGEEQGMDYHFVSREEYTQLESRGQFAVTDTVFNPKYGLLNGTVEGIIAHNQVPVGEVYSPNIGLFRDVFPQSYAIFLFPKSLEILRERMEKRGDKEQTIIARPTSVQDGLRVFHKHTYKFFDKTYVINSDYLSHILNDVVISFFN